MNRRPDPDWPREPWEERPDWPREPWDERPDWPREPWDERPDWPHGQWDERPDEPQMPWDERPPRRGLGRPRRPPWDEREWETATDLLRNQLTRVLLGGKHPRTKNPDAESRQPPSAQAD